MASVKTFYRLAKEPARFNGKWKREKEAVIFALRQSVCKWSCCQREDNLWSCLDRNSKLWRKWYLLYMWWSRLQTVLFRVITPCAAFLCQIMRICSHGCVIRKRERWAGMFTKPLWARPSPVRNRAAFRDKFTFVKLTRNRSVTSSFLMQKQSYLLSCSPETRGTGLWRSAAPGWTSRLQTRPAAPVWTDRFCCWLRSAH